MAKQPKQGKQSNEQLENQSKKPEKVNVSGRFMDTIKDSLTDFSKISETKRIDLYGNQEFLDQFREYFKKEHPDLLGSLSKDELPRYLTELEKKGFSIHKLTNSADKLHAEFRPEKPEYEVMQETLGKFDTFCKDSINNIPAGTYKKFAEEAGFDHESHVVTKDSKLQTIDDLYIFWKNFAEKEGISLKDNQKKNIESILCPDYDPVERIMVEVAITKLKKEMKGDLRDAFNDSFALPLTAFSSLGNLRTFKQQWLTFLENHAQEIDKPLAKKLDEVIVTNGDIKNMLMVSGKKFDTSKGFEEQEHYFMRVFNKLATRQLFEEFKDTQGSVEKYIDIIHEAVRGFPPYVNELFKLYPYDDNEVVKHDLGLQAQLAQIDPQITQIELTIANDKTSKEERFRLRKKRQELKQQREELKWRAYIKYLATKDQALATVMSKLVGARFDFTQISLEDQQIILNVLVKHKFNGLIAKKAPELLGVNAEELKQFIDELFDLSKKDLTLPTRDGPVHIVFKEKKFLSQQATQLLSVNDLSNIKSLPLQFVIQPTPSSQDFFEQGVLWGNEGGQLFDTFQSKTGPVIINDGYRVKLTKDGKSVSGYLSQYPPSDDVDDTNDVTPDQKIQKGTRRYLYSHAVTDATQERKRVTREGTDKGTPVVVDELAEKTYNLDVLDRSFALNGEAIGSLIFAHVLGQQSFNNEISQEQENQLAKELGRLDTFLDTQRNHLLVEDETGEEGATSDKVAETKEDTQYDKFLEGRKAIAGYSFPEDMKDFGFKVGSRVFIKGGESELPPKEIEANTWMYLDITKIDKDKGTMIVSLHGGEYGLGKYEGTKKEIPLKASSWDTLKEILGEDMYKVPCLPNTSFDTQLGSIKQVFGKLYEDNFTYTFDTIKSNNGGFQFTQGDYIGKDVAAFGYDMKIPEYDEDRRRTKERIQTVLFEVKRNSDGSYHVSCKNNMVDEKGKPIPKFTRDMDPVSFALFIAGKKLQPKTSEDVAKQKELKDTEGDRGMNKPRQRFSINNIVSFFSTSVSKVKDSIKKYDDERAEDLTDMVLDNGDLFNKFGKARGGLSKRIGESFQTAGMEYYTTRDARVWKKIEKRQKFYEQEKHHSTFFNHELRAMIDGRRVPKDMYKIPAILLTMINKEKSPYARVPDMIGKGQRVNMMLGKKHQQKYLSIVNRKMADVRQNSLLNGTDWTIHRNEEIVKLEMKYLVDVIDNREHGSNEEEIYQSSKWSRAFADKLTEAMDTKFGFDGISSKHSEINKNKGTTFEFAEFEYGRHTRNNRPSNALPFLKVMAEQAQTKAQWQQFEMHVISSTLSGQLLYHTDATTKGWFKDICRTRGFIPGLFAKDIDQQTKMLSLINIFLKSSGKKFEDFEMSAQKKSMKYSVDKFAFGNMANSVRLVADGFKTRWFDNNNGSKFSEFLETTGKDSGGKKTLIELAEDPNLDSSERALLEKYIKTTNEKSQDMDPDVKHNFSAMAGTPFTKCETIVMELFKYDNGTFDGKDSHEKEGPALFRGRVAKDLPKGKATPSDIVFYTGKFLNWFDGEGFSDGDQKTQFIKRLLTVQKMFASTDPAMQKQAEDTLWYTINGTILKENTAGKGKAPDEFEAALNAFKNFFKSNLDQVLSPHILSTTMSDFYAKDTNTNTPYGIGDWKEYVRVMTNRAALLDQDETIKQANKEITNKYSSGDYAIYNELYSVAQDLERSKGQTNRFKSYYKYGSREVLNNSGSSSQAQQGSSSGVAITNPHDKNKADALKDTLNGKGKNRSTDEEEELASAMEYGHP